MVRPSGGETAEGEWDNLEHWVWNASFVEAILNKAHEIKDFGPFEPPPDQAVNDYAAAALEWIEVLGDEASKFSHFFFYPKYSNPEGVRERLIKIAEHLTAVNYDRPPKGFFANYMRP